MRLDAPTEGEPSLGVAPLLDIVFLLLVFFMVTTSFTTAELPLDLAEAASAAAPDPREPLVIEISAEGVYFAQGAPLTEDALAVAFETERGSGDARVVVRADQAVAHRSVVRVLDLARAAGITDVAIAVDARGGPASSAR